MTSVPSNLSNLKAAAFPIFGEALLKGKGGGDGDGVVLTFGAPRALMTRVRETCPGLNIVAKPLAGVYSSRPSLFVAGFCYLQTELTRAVPAFKRLVAPGGTLWVLWPKPAAWDAEGIRPEMGITVETVGGCAASLGLAVVQSVEVDEVWRGVKLAIRGTTTESP